MVVSGTLFFLLFASNGSPGRFLSLFFKSYGLSDAQVGFLCSAGYLFSMLLSPVVNRTADKLNEHELVCITGFAISLACFLLQRIAHVLPVTTVFPFLLFIYTLHSAADYATYPLVCAMSISRLKRIYGHEAHERFGRDRLWGAVSWAIVSLAFGVIADKSEDGVELISYFGKLFFGVIFIVALALFRIHKNGDYSTNHEASTEDIHCDIESSQEKENEDKTESISWENTNLSGMRLIRMLTEGGYPTIFFYILILSLEAGMSNVEQLLFIYFKEDLGASYALCGLTVVVTVIFEIPMFALAPQLLRFLGSKYLALLGALSFVIRGIGYSMVQNVWAVLIFEPLHGVTYAAMATASVSFVSERSPPELEATSQSLLAALLSLANVVGVLIGGLVMEWLGSRVLYRGAALIVLAAAILLLTADKVYHISGSTTDDNDEDQSNSNER